MAANQNSHLLSCSTQVNLSSGAQSPAISAKEDRDEESQHAPKRAPPQDVHSAQRELSQTGTESILGDVRNEFFPLLKRQNRFMKLGLGFDLIAHQLVGRKTREVSRPSSSTPATCNKNMQLAFGSFEFV